MKQISVLSGIIISILSICLIVIGVCISGFDFTEVFNGEYEKETYVSETNEINKIKVDYVNANIEVQLKAQESFTIDYFYYPEVTEADAFESNGTLYCLSTVTNTTANIFGGFFGIPKVVITVPKTAQSFSLEIDNINGSIQIKNQNLNSCSIKSTNGYIRIENSVMSSASARTTNGYCYIDDCTIADNLTIGTTNSYVTCDKVIVGNSLLCTTTNSYIKMIETSATTLSSRSTSGYIKYDKVSSKYITAQTTNGYISVNVIGNKLDYCIEYADSTKNVNLPAQNLSSNFYLKLNTTNGKIDYSFK